MTNDEAKAGSDLRSHIFRSGYTLILRQVATVLLKFVGVLIVSRILGPDKYAAYIAAYGIYSFVLAAGQSGIGLYLIRAESVPSAHQIGVATTFLLIESTAIVIIVELLAGPLGNYVDIAGFPEVLRIMILALPIQTLAVPAFTQVERGLNLKGVAIIEMAGQTGYYVCALPLALAGLGPSALAYALLFQNVLSLPIICKVAKARLTFAWDYASVTEMLRFAMGFSAAGFVWQLRGLVNPFIFGPVLGATSVGVIAMAVSILEMLTLARTMLWRVTIAAMARFRNDTGKLRRIIGEGMEIQLLTIGVVLLGFGWLGGVVVHVVLGDRWLPLFRVYPYIALSYLTISTFNMHTAALTLLNKNWLLVAFQSANVIAFAGAAIVFSRVGRIEGYGYAEMASLPTYGILHYFLARRQIAPNYHPAALWWLAAAIGLFWRELGVWAIAVPFAALLVPPSPARLKAMALNLRSGANRK